MIKYTKKKSKLQKGGVNLQNITTAIKRSGVLGKYQHNIVKYGKNKANDFRTLRREISNAQKSFEYAKTQASSGLGRKPAGVRSKLSNLRNAKQRYANAREEARQQKKQQPNHINFKTSKTRASFA